MSDSIRHHLTSFAVLAALICMPLYGEFLAPNLQIFRTSEATFNAPVYDLLRLIGGISALVAFCFAIAGLIAMGTNRALAWPLAIAALLGALVLFVMPSANLGVVVEPPLHWVWCLAAGIIAMIFPLFKTRYLMRRIWTVGPLLLGAVLGLALFRFAEFGDGQSASIMTEFGLVLGFAAPIILALVLSASKSAGLIHALIGFGTLVLLMAIGWAAYRLGLDGVAMGYSEVPADLSGDAFSLACAMIGLSLLVLGTAIWISQTQNELLD